jgi:hypothetical protein
MNSRNTSSVNSTGNGHSSSGGTYNLAVMDSSGFVNTNGEEYGFGCHADHHILYLESDLSRPEIQYMAVKPEDTSDLIGQVRGSKTNGSLAAGFIAPSMLP